jgi:hypothetical protein
MDRPIEARVTRRPAMVLMRASGLPAIVVGGLVAAGFGVSSPAAAASVGVGVVVALVALSAGPALLAVLRSVSPPAAMPLALITYGAIVMLLAVLYLQLLAVPWLVGGAVGAGIGAATVAWLAGMIRAVPRLRIPIFAGSETGSGTARDAGQDGSPASPSSASH